MTSRRPFAMLAAAIFLLMALVHVYRLIAGFDVTIGGTEISQSVSWFAIVITGLLAVLLYREAKH